MTQANLPRRRRYDVVIVGAGPTGLVLANVLGKAGRSVLLVEANDATVSEPRAVSIDDESLRVVQNIGLLDPVTNEIAGGYGSEYRGPDGSMFLKVAPAAQPYGHPRRNPFRQPLFEAQLREGLARFPTVETLFATTVTAFSEEGDIVVAALRHRDGTLGEAAGQFLIGCDGARSEIRQALGANLQGDSLNERWLIVDLVDSPAPTRETIVFCDSRRPCIALPGPRQTRRYEFKVMPGESEEALIAEANVARLLEEHGAAPGSRIIRKTIYHFHARIVDSWGRGRVWLAGDAAHLSPPFAGQGMNSGVRDAFNLGWKLDQVLAGRFGPALLDSYPRERHAHVGQMIQLALRMGAIMGPRTRLHGFLIRTFFRALGLWPAARSYFAEMKYKPPPRFNDGFLVRSMLTRRGLVGRMLPQPVLHDGPHQGQRLDELLGDGFVLVGIGIAGEDLAQVSLGAEWDALIDRRVALPVAWAPDLAERAGAGNLLLLRPDRYVMASFTPSQASQTAAALQNLLRKTWAGHRPPTAPASETSPNPQYHIATAQR